MVSKLRLSTLFAQPNKLVGKCMMYLVTLWDQIHKTVSAVIDRQFPGKGGWWSIKDCGTVGPECFGSSYDSTTCCDLGQVTFLHYASVSFNG